MSPRDGEKIGGGFFVFRRGSPAVLRSNGDGNPAFVETEDPDLTQVVMPMMV